LFAVRLLVEPVMMLADFGEQSSIERTSEDERMMALVMRSQSPVGDACRPFQATWG
jgi:hypothetical protein